MGKYGSLLKDLFLFTLSTFIPKAISFFLVPLYTNCLTTAEYGVADLVSTTVGLAIPLITLNINDAVMRFTIENKEDARPFQIAFLSIVKGILLISGFVCLNMALRIIRIDHTVSLFFLLNYSFVAVYGICIAYIRATNQVALLSAISILTSAATVVSNLLLLLVFKLGMIGYMISGCVGYALADLIILWKIHAVRMLKSAGLMDKSLRREMLLYSTPLIAANISWWINTSSDRYILTAMRGVDEDGIYSVAYKIPTILQMLQSVFSQAWLLSVFREYKSENGPQYVSRIYELYYVAMSLSCAVIIILDIPLAGFLYAKDFYAAWKYVPFLLLSVVFIANSGFFESMLTLHKKTKLIASTTVIGAVVNTVLNLILIYYIGALGAAIATVCGYFTMWVTRIRPVLKEYPFEVNWTKQIIMYLLLVAEAIVMTITGNMIVCIVLAAVMFGMNYSVVAELASKGYGKIRAMIGKAFE